MSPPSRSHTGPLANIRPRASRLRFLLGAAHIRDGHRRAGGRLDALDWRALPGPPAEARAGAARKQLCHPGD